MGSCFALARWDVGRVVGSAVDVGYARLQRGPGIHHGRADRRIALGHAPLEGLQALVHRADVLRALCGAAPDDHHAAAVVLVAKALDVGDQLIREIPLGAAALHVRAVQVGHVGLVEHRRHWLDL